MKRISTLAVLLSIGLPVAAQSPKPPAHVSGETNGFTVEDARGDLPLQIGGATFGSHLRVILANVTSRKVTEVSVGVLLKDESAPAPVTRVGKVCKTNLGQDQLLLVEGAYAGFPDVDAYFRSKGMSTRIVSVGITRVRFADGTEWSLPIETPGRFDRKGDPDTDKKLKEVPHIGFSVLSPPRNIRTCRGAPPIADVD
jgi:hypothetical protein